VVIYQELSLVPERSIAENLYLGHLPRNVAGIVDTKRLNADAAAVLARVGLHVNPQRPVRRLRLAEQQLVEIARALWASMMSRLSSRRCERWAPRAWGRSSSAIISRKCSRSAIG
jgi:ABC-type sugar transport system ATPase subunit